jgi:hypothetical protein
MRLPRHHPQASATFDKEAATQTREDGDTLPPPFDLEEFARQKMTAGIERQPTSDIPTKPPPEDPPSGTRRRAEASDPLAEARAMLAGGDYAGALVLVEAELEENPIDKEAVQLAEECRRLLEKTYIQRLGSLDRIPMIRIDPADIKTLAIDHRGGFLLSLVDGMSNLEMVLDISGMPRLDALRMLFGFLQDGTIALE